MKLDDKYKTSLKSFLIYGLLPLILVVAIEPLYKASLYQKTLLEVPRMQQKKRLEGFFSFMTALGEFEVPMIVCMVLFNLTHKMKAVYIFFAFGFYCYLNSGILKQVYSESRPYWVSEEIKPETCRKDYGNPSGHCMSATFFWMTLYLN